MNYIVIVLALSLTFSCDKKVAQNIPIKKISQKAEKHISIESEIEMLRKEVQGITEKRVLKDLNKRERVQFKNRLKELKKNLNKTISLIQPDYSREAKRKLELSYARTKETWNYLIKNYKI